MIVRCGACRTQFQVPGAGRFACPTCGATNEVRGDGGGGPPPAPSGLAPGGPGLGDIGAPPPAPEPPPANVSRTACPVCSFEFFVGEIDVAHCPNCGAEVAVGTGGGDEEDG